MTKIEINNQFELENTQMNTIIWLLYMSMSLPLPLPFSSALFVFSSLLAFIFVKTGTHRIDEMKKIKQKSKKKENLHHKKTVADS